MHIVSVVLFRLHYITNMLYIALFLLQHVIATLYSLLHHLLM